MPRSSFSVTRNALHEYSFEQRFAPSWTVLRIILEAEWSHGCSHHKEEGRTS